MRFGAQTIAPSFRRATWVFVVAPLFLSLSAFHTVGAQDTKVQASVNSGVLHPALELTGISSPTTVEAMPLHLTGNVESLTQIQLRVDGTYWVTIPLDEGAISFVYDLVIPLGTHEVELVGISPFVDISPTVALSVTYVLPAQGPDAPGTTTGTNENKGGIVISHDSTSAGSTTYTEPLKTSPLPTWLYNGLIAVDLLRSDDVNGNELTKMAQRFTFMTTGLFFLSFARPTLSAYHSIRYTWLKFNKRPMPHFVSKHPLGYIRVIGLALIGGVFIFV